MNLSAGREFWLFLFFSSKLEPQKENEIINIHGVACKPPPVHGRWEVVQYSGWTICGRDSGIWFYIFQKFLCSCWLSISRVSKSWIESKDHVHYWPRLLHEGMEASEEHQLPLREDGGCPLMELLMELWRNMSFENPNGFVQEQEKDEILEVRKSMINAWKPFHKPLS